MKKKTKPKSLHKFNNKTRKINKARVIILTITSYKSNEEKSIYLIF